MKFSVVTLVLLPVGVSWQGNYFHVKFPDEVVAKQYLITILENVNHFSFIKIMEQKL